MRALLPLLLLLAAVPAGADDKEAARLAREKEEARIQRRIELKKAFNSAEKLVQQKFEAFALQPIRTWEGAMAAVLKEEKAALLNPIRYYLLDEDWEVQAFTCVVIGRAGLAELLPELEQAYADARYPIIRRKAVEKGHARGDDRTKLLAELDRIDVASAGMFVPRSIVQDYVDFRQFLHDMRERVAAGAERG